MKRAGIKDSFRAAFWGLLTTVATQKHMKFHLTSAVLVMLVGMALRLDPAARTALLFCVALVLFAEILNTALEQFVDLHIQEFHTGAMAAKDASAAGVLVLALATVAVLADVLWSHWSVVQASPEQIRHSLTFGLPLTALMVMLLWGPERLLVRLPLGLAGLGLAIPLWRHSVNPVFSVCLGLFLGLAIVSRPRPIPDPAGFDKQ